MKKEKKSIKEPKKKRKIGRKQLIAIILTVVLFIVAVGGVAVYQYVQTDKLEEQTQIQNQRPQRPDGNMNGQFKPEGMGALVSGEGTTEIGTIEQQEGFDAATVSIEVEEVYVEEGSEVSTGDALLKLSTEDLEMLETKYEASIVSAENALKQTKIEYETGILEAEYTLELTQAQATSADTDLTKSLEELENSVSEAAIQYTQAQAEYEEYQQKINNDTYAEESGVKQAKEKQEKLKQSLETQEKETQRLQLEYESYECEVKSQLEAYQKNIQSLEAQQRQAETEYQKIIQQLYANAGLESTEKANSESMEELALRLKNAEKAVADAKTAVEKKKTENASVERTLGEKQRLAQEASQQKEQLQRQAEEAERSVQQAQSIYERQVEEAKRKIEELERTLPELKSSYEQAVLEKVTKQMNIHNTYEKAVVNGDYAQSVYDATILNWKNTLQAAEEKVEELKAEKAVILSITDGILVADRKGTIASVIYEAGDILVNDSAICYYYDSGNVQITVEVSQDNISEITVGDTAMVSISDVGRGNFTGIVKSIGTEAAEDRSVSEVLYEVVIIVDNSDGSVSAGLSATVMFGSMEFWGPNGMMQQGMPDANINKEQE